MGGKPWRYSASWLRFASGVKLLPALPLALHAFLLGFEVGIWHLASGTLSEPFWAQNLMGEIRCGTSTVWLRFAYGLEPLPALPLAPQASFLGFDVGVWSGS